jgi:hypothetical protein
MNYHLLFQDDGGNVYSHANLVADSNDAAIDTARRIYRTGIGGGYEIWGGGRHLHTEGPRPNPSR